MLKDYKSLIIFSTAVIIFLGAQMYSRTNNEHKISNLLSETNAQFDSFNRFLESQNVIVFKLDSLIQSKQYIEALNVIDTANITENRKWNYRGEIAFKQGDIRQSINYFNKAIALDKLNCYTIANRANSFNQLKLFDSAIKDYKFIALINYDFYKPLAETYQMAGQKDSAIKYYQIYLKNYPDSISVWNKFKN